MTEYADPEHHYQCTDKQKETLDKWLAVAKERGIYTSVVHKSWRLHGQPGRWNDLTFFAGDADGVVTGSIDVYGNGWCNYVKTRDDEWHDIDAVVDHAYVGSDDEDSDGECLYVHSETQQRCRLAEDNHVENDWIALK